LAYARQAAVARLVPLKDDEPALVVGTFAEAFLRPFIAARLNHLLSIKSGSARLKAGDRFTL
jgi:hypothetical protein